MGLLDWLSGDPALPDDQKKVAATPAPAPIINYYKPTQPSQQPTVNYIGGAAAPPQQQQPTYPPLPPQPWPTQADVEAARDYKTRFGNVNEQMIQSGLLANQIPPDAATQFDAQNMANKPPPMTPTPINQPTADALEAAQIAAQRSPLGYLGYDVNRMTVTAPHQGETPFGYAGTYYPNADRLWSDLNFPSNPVHESLHRGIALLRQQGAQIDPDMEEAIVRAEMQKYYGNVEKTNPVEIEQGRSLLSDPKYKGLLDKIEQQANEAIAKRNLERGPL